LIITRGIADQSAVLVASWGLESALGFCSDAGGHIRGAAAPGAFGSAEVASNSLHLNGELVALAASLGVTIVGCGGNGGKKIFGEKGLHRGGTLGLPALLTGWQTGFLGGGINCPAGGAWTALGVNTRFARSALASVADVAGVIIDDESNWGNDFHRFGGNHFHRFVVRLPALLTVWQTRFLGVGINCPAGGTRACLNVRTWLARGADASIADVTGIIT